MSDKDDKTDMPDNIDEAKGRAKQAVGDLTGDQDLEREGEADEATGGIKEKVDDAADKVKDTVDDIRDRLN